MANTPWRASLPALLACGIGAACAEAQPTAAGPVAHSLEPAPMQVDLGQEFPLRNSESTAVGREGLLLRFDRVTRDDRCPVGDPCTTEGDAVVEVTVRQPPNDPATVELHTDPTRPTQARYLSYSVRLVRLEPRPVGEQAVPLPQYVGTFVVGLQGREP